MIKIMPALVRFPSRMSRKHGFSLVEGTIVLGVVGLVIGGIWVGAAAVSKNFNDAKTAEAVLSVVEQLRIHQKALAASDQNIYDLTSLIGGLPQGFEIVPTGTGAYIAGFGKLSPSGFVIAGWGRGTVYFYHPPAIPDQSRAERACRTEGMVGITGLLP